jgi:hypothetical protein
MEDVINPVAPSGEVGVESEEKRAARSAIAFEGQLETAQKTDKCQGILIIEKPIVGCGVAKFPGPVIRRQALEAMPR